MTGWHQRAMVAYDCETTGVSADTDRIVTAAMFFTPPADNQQIQPQEWSWLVNPGIPIPAGAAAIHGVTTDHAQQHGRLAFEAVDQITMYLAATLAMDIPIVCANAAFDLTILDRECRRWMLPTLADRADGRVEPIVDIQVLDKQIDPFRKGRRNLEALCAHYKVQIDRAHDAMADAKAAMRVAWRICQQHPEIADTSLDELHQQQIQWRQQQQTGLAAYFRRQGRHADAQSVDTAWPVIPYEEPL